MVNTNTTRTIVGAVLVSISIFSLFLCASLYQQMKATESKFNKEKATLIKEGMDLQDKIDALAKEVKEKTSAVSVVESEKKSILEKAKALEDEKRVMAERYMRDIEALKKENDLLNRKVESSANISLTQFLKEASAKEENETIKKLIEILLSKIELVKAGKSVNLEPIVVIGEAAAAQQKEAEGAQGKTGKILSVDKNNNLIVIDIGRASGVKEAQRCIILKDDKEIASGEVISTRYKISAVFVGEIKYGYTINDIKEGDGVSVKEG